MSIFNVLLLTVEAHRHTPQHNLLSRLSLSFPILWLLRVLHFTDLALFQTMVLS
jgi:hypothetical protein